MKKKHKAVTRKTVYAAMKKAQAERNADMNARLNAPLLPSVEAMGLAEMVLDRATRRKDKGEVTQVVVAEMLDSALRIRRAAAEVGGIQKGRAEARAQIERAICTGFVATVANKTATSPPMVVSAATVCAVRDALINGGYGEIVELPETGRRWMVKAVQG